MSELIIITYKRAPLSCRVIMYIYSLLSSVDQVHFSVKMLIGRSAAKTGVLLFPPNVMKLQLRSVHDNNFQRIGGGAISQTNIISCTS